MIKKSPVLLSLLVAAGPLNAADSASSPYDEEAARLINTFTYPEPFELSLFADETQLKNAVAFDVDEQGRFFVSESNRWRRGVDDNRERLFWILDDLMIESTADRVAMYEKWREEVPMSYYDEYAEVVRLVVDRDGDGRADFSTNWADGFDDVLEGAASGVVVRDGVVHFTSIPRLYRLEDPDGDNVAEVRETLLDGFGPRVGISGHDMHGIVYGPDGRIYWSIGDRGFNVESKEGQTFAAFGRGAVFRSNPDGTEFEVYHHGLRNPQELAFDAYGNLFTVDNNADIGDRARIAQIVEGADSGWSTGWQQLTTFRQAHKITGDRVVPWLEEGMWRTVEEENEVHWVLPPLGYITSGPSGLAYYPGTGFGDDYLGSFFICDYRGGATQSGVQRFVLDEAGAGFSVREQGEFLTGIAATDVTFGYDGKMYILDYIGGWTTTEKGRIFAVTHPEGVTDPRVDEVTSIFNAGFRELSSARLGELMRHVDLRVRTRAHLELARRGMQSVPVLEAALNKANPVTTRLHGLWGLAVIGQSVPEANARLLPLLDDADHRVRSQAAKYLGDNGHQPAVPKLIALLNDPHDVVGTHAAIALGNLDAQQAAPALIAYLAGNDQMDRHVLHAGMYGVLQMDDPALIHEMAFHESVEVRMAAVLAMRRTGDPQIATLLRDSDQAVYEEAVRVIYDQNIVGAMDPLAGQLEAFISPEVEPLHPGVSSLNLRRMVQANFRLGTLEHARRLVALAATTSIPDEIRVYALEALADWAKPNPVDRIVGLYRPLPERNISNFGVELGEAFTRAIENSTGNVQARAIDVAGGFGVGLEPATMLAQIKEDEREPAIRVSMIRRLAADGYDTGEFVATLRELTAAEDVAVRAAAVDALRTSAPESALDAVRALYQRATGGDQQAALTIAAQLPATAATRFAASVADELVSGKVAPAALLEMVRFLESVDAAPARAALGKYRATFAPDDVNAPYRFALQGGDVARGKAYFDQGVAQCLRCHRIDGTGGDVGPDLSTIGKDQTREQLLQAIVAPNASVAKGYGTVSGTLKNGEDFDGVLTDETDATITLKLADGSFATHRRSDIQTVSAPFSSMPPMVEIISPEDLRDLIAYLADQTSRESGH